MPEALQDFAFYNNIEDYLQKSFAGNMIRYAPNGTAPLFALTSMMGDGTALSVEHGYFAKTMLFPQMASAAAHAAGDTTLTVDSTEKILAGDLFRVSTSGEIIRVTEVVSATEVTVTRSIGEVAADAIGDGDNLYGVGNAFQQASQRPASRLMNPVRTMNYTQIFRNSWALPHTMEVIRPIVGDSLTGESRQDCAMLHAADIEKALIFGQRSQQVVQGQLMTTMDGLVETIRRLAPPENTNTAGATTNYTELEEMLNPVFDTINNGRNGNERVLFVGGQARQVINKIGRLSGQYQIVDGQTSFGLRFGSFKTSRGDFRMIEHPIFNSNPDWARMALAVDIPSTRLMYLPSRKTQNREYNTDGAPVDNGIDAVGGTLTSELTMENVNPSAHGVIFGLTDGAAE